MVLLKDLQELIYDDLMIVHKNNKYKNVYKYDDIFKAFENYEVIGIRSEDTYVVISIRSKYDV